MKKILFVLPIIALLAAGCGASQQVSNNSSPVAQNTSPTPSPAQTPVVQNSNPTTGPNIQIYTNSDLGFQISVPSAWHYSYSDGEADFAPAVNPDMTNYVAVSIASQTLEQISNIHNTQGPKSTETGITLAASTGYKYVYTDPGYVSTVEIYLSHNGKVYLISTQRNDLPEVTAAINSFQFINTK